MQLLDTLACQLSNQMLSQHYFANIYAYGHQEDTICKEPYTGKTEWGKKIKMTIYSNLELNITL